MGKAKRWFRALLGAKKPSALPAPSSFRQTNQKCGPIKLSDGNKRDTGGGSGGASSDAFSTSPYAESVDANKHAIAVAAATAAVAEAALAAAKAAAEVVRMTSGGGGGGRASTANVISGSCRQRQLAAVTIQSAFRAYLARRALRALKGLVKLQALVRGHIVRKQSTNMLRRMQAMARIQARACAKRAYMSDSPNSSSNSSHSHHRGHAAPQLFDHQLRAYNAQLDRSALKKCSTKSDIKGNVGLAKTNSISIWFDRWMEENSRNNRGETILKNGLADDEKSDKILEIDTGNPHPHPKRGEQIFMPFESLSRHSTKSQKPNTALPTMPALSLMSLNFPQEIDQAALWTSVSSPQVPSISSRPGSSYRRGPENSPQVHSVSSRPGSSNRRGPFTPARSECSRSLFGEYLSYPNYMANTESSRAKFRSQSAPRQRMEFEKPGSTKMFVRGFWDVDTSNSDKGSTLHANFRSRGHPAYSSGNYGSRC
ncbi:hypothetical protein LguiA_024038 [Lonicera macranthoides]